MMRTATRGVLLALGTIGVIWFLIPFVTKGIINIGNITGIFVSICFVAYGFTMPYVHKRISEAWSHMVYRVILCVVGLCLTLVAVTAVILTALMIRTAVQKPAENKTVIVLGCRVYGERASLMLKERLEAAYQYLEENTESACILSGGQGPGEDISEAECMYRYLTDKGIDSTRLYKEDKSTSTRENIAFSKEIMEAENLDSEVAIVTNEFHEYRAKKVADAEGVKSYAVSGKTAWWLLPTYYVRELYGILYEWIL